MEIQNRFLLSNNQSLTNYRERERSQQCYYYDDALEKKHGSAFVRPLGDFLRTAVVASIPRIHDA